MSCSLNSARFASITLCSLAAMHALLVLVLLPVLALALAAGPPSFPEPWTGIVSLQGPDGATTTVRVLDSILTCCYMGTGTQ